MIDLPREFKVKDKVIVDPEWKHHNEPGVIISLCDPQWYEVKIKDTIYVCHIDDLHRIPLAAPIAGLKGNHV